nr:oligosaccharide flippase family protein [Deltaproteobacteria bacterium]
MAVAKAWFLLTGFAQPLVLTRLLLGEGYGLYGVVLNVISILNNVVVAGSIQAMSHAVTDGGVTALRKGLLIHAALGLTLAGALLAGADLLGAGVLHDPRLPPLLRIGAIIVADYSVYAALVGALNGPSALPRPGGPRHHLRHAAHQPRARPRVDPSPGHRRYRGLRHRQLHHPAGGAHAAPRTSCARPPRRASRRGSSPETTPASSRRCWSTSSRSTWCSRPTCW